MTRIFANYKNGEPGVHVFIVGVSAYSHLLGGSHKTIPRPYGMGQLTSPARSAYRIYQWLLNNKDIFSQPLRSVRLLLSPFGPSEVDEPVDRCTREYFKSEFFAWRDDASTHRDNITIFYFAGHGIQIDTNKSTNMLMEDFGEDPNYLLEKGVDLGNVLDLMRPTQDLKDIARTQIYFIDCCRTGHPDLENLQNPEPSPPLRPIRISSGIRDDRLYPVYYSSIRGAEAFERPNGTLTFFAGALLECLDGRAADKLLDPESGKEGWYVTSYKLCEVLNKLLDRKTLIQSARVEGYILALPKEYDRPVHLDGSTQSFIICTVSTSPKVKVKLSIVPTHALDYTKVTAKLNAITEREDISTPLKPHPYEAHWDAGIYLLGAEIISGKLGYKNYGPELCILAPDSDFIWEARMQ